MLWTILIIILILALVGGLPQVGWYGRGYGYGPSGVVGVVVLILIILLVLGRL